MILSASATASAHSAVAITSRAATSATIAALAASCRSSSFAQHWRQRVSSQLAPQSIQVPNASGISPETPHSCAAAAGIPLTHRDLASSVTFVSGHAKDGAPRLDWPALAQGRQTIVVYMGVTTAPLIARRLIAHGLAPGTPVAVVENGTLPDQRVLTGNLRDLATLISANRVTAPALIIIGEVVALSNAVSNAAAPSLAQADAAQSVARAAAAMSVAV